MKNIYSFKFLKKMSGGLKILRALRAQKLKNIENLKTRIQQLEAQKDAKSQTKIENLKLRVLDKQQELEPIEKILLFKNLGQGIKTEKNLIYIERSDLQKFLNDRFDGKLYPEISKVTEISRVIAQSFFSAIQRLQVLQIPGIIVIRFMNLKLYKITEKDKQTTLNSYSYYVEPCIASNIFQTMTKEQFIQTYLEPSFNFVRPDYISCPFIYSIRFIPRNPDELENVSQLLANDQKILKSIRVWDDDTVSKSKKRQFHQGSAFPLEGKCLFQSVYISLKYYENCQKRYEEHKKICLLSQQNKNAVLSKAQKSQVIKIPRNKHQQRDDLLFEFHQEFSDMNHDLKTQLLDHRYVSLKTTTQKFTEATLQAFSELPEEIQETVISGDFYNFFTYWARSHPEITLVVLNTSGPQLYIFENTTEPQILGLDIIQQKQYLEEYQKLRAHNATSDHKVQDEIQELIDRIRTEQPVKVSDIPKHQPGKIVLYFILEDNGQNAHIMTSSFTKIKNNLPNNCVSIINKLDNLKRLTNLGFINCEKFLQRRVIIPAGGNQPKREAPKNNLKFIAWDIESASLPTTVVIGGHEKILQDNKPIMIGIEETDAYVDDKTGKLVLAAPRSLYFWGFDAIIQFVKYVYKHSKSYLNGNEGKSERHKSACSRDSQNAKNASTVILLSFNGSCYDNLFIQPLLKRYFPAIEYIGTKTMSKHLKVENIEFIDVRCLIPGGSLNRLSETFLGIANQKDSFNLGKLVIDITDFKNFELGGSTEYRLNAQDKEECIKYCIQDCALTSKIYFKYIESLFEIGKKYVQDSPIRFSSREIIAKFTAASVATFLFNRVFPPSVSLFAFPDYITTLARKAYYGGATMCFKKRAETQGFIFGLDINSSYPYQCLKPIPTDLKSINNFAQPQLLTKAFFTDSSSTDSITQLFKLSSFNFNTASASAKNKPNLPVRHATLGNYNPVFCQASETEPLVYWAPEIQLAVEQGAEIYITSVLTFETSIQLADYMNTLYSERCRYKTSLPAYAETLKILLNSLTGKFGQNIQEETKMITEASLCSFFIQNSDDIIDYEQIANSEKIGDPQYLLTLRKTENSSHSIGDLVHIIGFVTSHARTQLFDAIYKVETEFPNSICYCDTDSMIIDVGVAPEKPHDILKHEKFIQDLAQTPLRHHENLEVLKSLIRIDSKTLGGWKIEKIIPAESYYGITAKVYCFDDYVESKQNVKCKGVSQTQTIYTPDSYSTHQVITAEDIKKLGTDTESVVFTQTQFLRHMGEIMVDTSYNRTVSNENTKRLTLDDYHTLPPADRIPETTSKI